MNKKAEITTHQLVLLIVLIIGFAIILFLLFRLNLGKESDSEICHNSVMERSTLISTTSTSDAVPLDCQRNYVCITKDGSCESLTSPTKKKVKSEEDIQKVLATELRDCWWMFGEGDVNYVGKDLFPGNLYCSLCSQIAFDDSVKEIIPSGELDQKKFYEYLAKTKVPEKSITYAEYLYGTNDLNILFGEAMKQGAGFGKIDLNSQYYAFTAITSDINKVVWGVVGGIAAIGIATAVVGSGGTVLFLAGAGGAAGGGLIIAPVVDTFFGKKIIPPVFVKANSEEFEKFGCDEIETKS